MGGILSNTTKNGFSLSSSSSTDDTALRFHSVHGDNITLSQNCTIAKRTDSFCKGVTFSNRPLYINEKIWVKFIEITSSWSGSFRFGVTNHDPCTMRGAIPKYACPDLTNRDGHWAKAIPEHMVETNCVLFFYVTNTGDVHFGVNNVDSGVFFSGVDTRSPLWAILDIYGNTVAIQLIAAEEQCLNNQVALVRNEQQELEATDVSQTFTDSQSSGDDLARRCSYNQFEYLCFHEFHGRNIWLSNESMTAARQETEFAQGYVFTATPLPLNRWLVIEILHTSELFVGALAFGLTSCDPTHLNDNNLPDDADMLLDRQEYWVVCKDVANMPAVRDKLAFRITSLGEVLFMKNDEGPTTLMHVDQTQQLWAFFDVYGNTQKIAILGLLIETGSGTLPTGNYVLPTSPRRDLEASCPTTYEGTMAVDGSRDNAANECTVCYERAVDSVLYKCGHMCMCYTCAEQQWKNPGSGQCPICRAEIKDVIRIYRS